MISVALSQDQEGAYGVGYGDEDVMVHWEWWDTSKWEWIICPAALTQQIKKFEREEVLPRSSERSFQMKSKKQKLWVNLMAIVAPSQGNSLWASWLVDSRAR